MTHADAAHAQDGAAVLNIAPAPEAVLSAGHTDLQRGLAALEAGNSAEAAAAFQTSYDLDKNPVALLNLGIAYTNLGKPHLAVKALSAYLEHATADADTQKVRDEIARLRDENGRVLLTLIPAGASVQVDGEAIEPNGSELLLSPGRRRISVLAEGYIPFNQTMDVQRGEFRLDIRLTPNAQTAAAAAPATPTQPTAPAHEPAADANEGDDPDAADSCAMGELCVGPVLALLGPPNLVGAGIHLRFGRYLGAGVDYQFLPNVNVSPVTFGANLMSVNARVYPFGGAFFLGGGFAYQSINATLRDGDVAAAARAAFPAATLNLGFMGRNGFILGADLGLMFPLASTHVTVEDKSGKLAQAGVTQEQIDSTKQDAQDRVNKVMNAMPVFFQVNLLRVGYLF